MKFIISLLFSLCIFFNSCAQQKFEKPPVPPQKKGMKKIQKHKKLFNYLNIEDLKQNKDNLYCWEIADNCNVLDGETTIYSYYQTTGTDNPTLVPYTYAEGEFLEGKYQGIWKYYDKNKKVIKKEKWDNGKLIYTEEYK
jgi:hypothetical protein